MNTTVMTQGNDGALSAASQDRVFDIVFKQDDLNWKDMIYDLVRSEGMNPWDIDISRLAERFLVMLNKLKEMDFRVSGKMVLTSSLLLKIKSDQLMNGDLQDFDDLINGVQEEEFLDEEASEFEQYDLNQFLNDQKKLVPRSPQPRERKVSVYDLVDALDAALRTDARRQSALASMRSEKEVEVPRKVFDLGETMERLQGQLKKLFTKKKSTVPFTDLLTSDTKEDKVFTFLPLLHLENHQKVNMLQKEHFGPIDVEIYHKKLM